MLGFLHWQDVKPGVTNISLSIFREGQAKAGFPGGSDAKASAWNVGDQGSIPGSGRSSGEGNGNPPQYSSWKIPWTEEHGRLQSMGSQRVGHD